MGFQHGLIPLLKTELAKAIVNKLIPEQNATLMLDIKLPIEARHLFERHTLPCGHYSGGRSLLVFTNRENVV